MRMWLEVARANVQSLDWGSLKLTQSTPQTWRGRVDLLQIIQSGKANSLTTSYGWLEGVISVQTSETGLDGIDELETRADWAIQLDSK